MSFYVAFCRVVGEQFINWKYTIITVTLFSWLDKAPSLGISPISLFAYFAKQPAFFLFGEKIPQHKPSLLRDANSLSCLFQNRDARALGNLAYNRLNLPWDSKIRKIGSMKIKTKITAVIIGPK